MAASVTGWPTHSMMSSCRRHPRSSTEFRSGGQLASTAAPNTSTSSAMATIAAAALVRASRAYSGSRVSREVLASGRNLRRGRSSRQQRREHDNRGQAGESGERHRPPCQLHERISSSVWSPSRPTSTVDSALNCASPSAETSGRGLGEIACGDGVDVHVLGAGSGGLMQKAAQRPAQLPRSPARRTVRRRGGAG